MYQFWCLTQRYPQTFSKVQASPCPMTPYSSSPSSIELTWAPPPHKQPCWKSLLQPSWIIFLKSIAEKMFIKTRQLFPPLKKIFGAQGGLLKTSERVVRTPKISFLARLRNWLCMFWRSSESEFNFLTCFGNLLGLNFFSYSLSWTPGLWRFSRGVTLPNPYGAPQGPLKYPAEMVKCMSHKCMS